MRLLEDMPFEPLKPSWFLLAREAGLGSLLTELLVNSTRLIPLLEELVWARILFSSMEGIRSLVVWKFDLRKVSIGQK